MILHDIVVCLQLMYFCSHTNAYVGFLRALSVVVGEHMPRIAIKMPKPPESPRPLSQARCNIVFVFLSAHHSCIFLSTFTS